MRVRVAEQTLASSDVLQLVFLSGESRLPARSRLDPETRAALSLARIAAEGEGGGGPYLSSGKNLPAAPEQKRGGQWTNVVALRCTNGALLNARYIFIRRQKKKIK